MLLLALFVYAGLGQEAKASEEDFQDSALVQSYDASKVGDVWPSAKASTKRKMHPLKAFVQLLSSVQPRSHALKVGQSAIDKAIFCGWQPSKQKSMKSLRLPPPGQWYDVGIAAYLGLTAIALAAKPKEVADTTPWSKFAVGYKFKLPVPAQIGMLTKYVPAFMLSAWAVLKDSGLAAGMMMVHYGKRIAEVLFLHDFTGSPIEDAATSSFVGAFYTMITWLFLRADVQDNLAPVGATLFGIGQCLNLYHHVLLRKLRHSTSSAQSKKKAAVSSKRYVVPKGGLFDLVACPHYLGEVIAWVGAALATQSLTTKMVAFWVFCMLGGRAAVTTEWYREKFGSEYPTSRKHMIPWIF